MSAVVRAELAEPIADAATAVDGVCGLGGDAAGEIATYLPGRRARGVRIGEDGRITVHIVVAYGTTVRMVAENVRRAVRTVADGPVDVVVVDVADADAADADAADAPGTDLRGPDPAADSGGPRPPR